jgi:hypothetical protein
MVRVRVRLRLRLRLRDRDRDRVRVRVRVKVMVGQRSPRDVPSLTILEQGEPPDAFYIMARGTVVVEIGGKVVATLEGINTQDSFNSLTLALALTLTRP